MRRLLVAISLLFSCPLAGAQPYQPPGYGVVQSVTPIPAPPAEESASAGASAPEARKKHAERYLVRVRMDDGTIQVRSVKRAEVKPGQRALVTNAGDVIPE